MWTALAGALGGAGGLAALLSPWLLHVAERARRRQAALEAFTDNVQQERDRAVERADHAAQQIAALWDYVYSLRYWMVKGCVGDPPTLPEGLSAAAVRARGAAA